MRLSMLITFFLVVGLTGTLSGCASGDSRAEQTLPAVTVFKSPTCGCCANWVEHMRQNGFEVKVTDVPDVSPMKRQYGVPDGIGSCHTAIVDGYVVEGHVPADVVKKLLAERPDVTGLAVPGMPVGSPGMEVEGRAPQPYDIVAFDQRGHTEVYARR